MSASSGKAKVREILFRHSSSSLVGKNIVETEGWENSHVDHDCWKCKHGNGYRALNSRGQTARTPERRIQI
jgi:hypothetical protein